MKMVLKRKDKSSICCPPKIRRHIAFSVKTKVIEFLIACTLLTSGFLLMIHPF